MKAFRACEGDGKGDFLKNQARAGYARQLTYADSLSPPRSEVRQAYSQNSRRTELRFGSVG